MAYAYEQDEQTPREWLREMERESTDHVVLQNEQPKRVGTVWSATPESYDEADGEIRVARLHELEWWQIEEAQRVWWDNR